MLSSIIKVAFTALALAFWQLFGQPLWNAWIESQGKAVGFGETALGWFMVLSVAWVVSALVTRRMKRND
jgi:hypothetical protein